MGLIEIILPLFVLLGAGFACVKTGYLPGEHSRALGAFVIKVSLPVMVFYAVSRTPLHEALNTQFLLAYGLGSLVAFAIAVLIAQRVLKLKISASAFVGLGASCSNSGFIGFPVAIMAFGDIAGAIMAQTMLVENLLIIPLTLFIAATGQRKSDSRFAVVLKALLDVMRNPLVIALVLALIVSGTGAVLPQALSDALGLLARVSAPMALFTIGATLAQLKLGDLGPQIGVITIGKLILHPLAVFAGLWLFYTGDPFYAAVGLTFAAAPMLSIYPILAQPFGLEKPSSAALFVTTLASLATISGLLWLLQKQGILG